MLVANADDPRIMARISAFTGRVITFGTSSGSDVRATRMEELGVEGTRAHVHTPDGEADVDVPLLGVGNLLNVLAATAVAHAHGVPLELPQRRPTTEEVIASEEGERLLAGFMLRQFADRVSVTAKGGRTTIMFHFDH